MRPLRNAVCCASWRMLCGRRPLSSQPPRRCSSTSTRCARAPAGRARSEALRSTPVQLGSGSMARGIRCWPRASAGARGVCGGSLEFDHATLTPRYRFLPGVPGASHALEVAERLEFPPALLERARHLTPESTREVERLIASLHGARHRMDEETARLEAARAAADAAAETNRAAAAATRDELKDLRRRLTSESDALLARARELWQTVQRESRREEKRRMGAGELRAGIEAVEAESEALRRAAAAAAGESAGALAERPIEAGTLAVGQRVRVADLGIEAEVATLPDAEGKLTLRRGSWNIQSHVSRLAATEGAPPPPRVNGGP